MSEYLAVRGKELADTVRTSFAVSRGGGLDLVWVYSPVRTARGRCVVANKAKISRFVFLLYLSRPGVPAAFYLPLE